MNRRNDKPDSTSRRTLVKGLVSGSGMIAASPLLRAAEGTGFAGSRADRASLQAAVGGRVFWRDDPGYERARATTCYRVNKPRRYPLVVVQPKDAQDVVQAVKFAAEHGLKVTTRSGGHGWSAAHIRQDCMLIDMSRMQTISVDPASQTVWTNPGVIGSRLNDVLGRHGLIVPTAHHPSPGIGGFVMQGGFGWNSRLWGNGAAHLEAVEVVTADGEFIRADASQNTDYLWAARGSGPGFFGVVTNMKLRTHPMPKVWEVSAFGFHDEVLEDLFAWSREMVPKYPEFVEAIMSSTAHDRNTGDWAPVRLTLAALAITDSEDEANAGLDLMNSCPVLDKAYFKVQKKPTNLTERYSSGYLADPAGHRFAVDNIYTNAPAEQLVPRMRKIYTGLPSPRTHVFWHSWGPIKPYPDDMALSVQGDVLISAYTLWTDPAQDEAMERWPVDRMKSIEDLSAGAQMNDENMLHHPQKYLSPEAYAKLERLRAKYDPNGVFETFMGKPYKPAVS